MTLPQCPVCGQNSLQPHCDIGHATCRWDRCINVACKANTNRDGTRHDHGPNPPTTCATCGPVTAGRRWGERT